MRNIPFTSNISFDRHANRYRVIKIKGGVTCYLATGRTLIEALMMRDWCRENNWSKFIRKTQYIARNTNGSFQVYKDIKHNGVSHRECFGTFWDLDDAINERDLLIKHNWNYEDLCCLE